MDFLLIPFIFISITFHEYSHGWVAFKLGDSTAKDAGRLTFNPLAHIDPFGTVILPVILLVLSQGAYAFGYAKPVPINPNHFKNPQKDMRWVSLAGPGGNFLLAIILAVFLKMSLSLLPHVASMIIVRALLINLILGFFNLIPIPPLDGSKVLASLLPPKFSYEYFKIERFGFLIIFMFLSLGFFKWLVMYIVLPFLSVLLSLLGININLW